MKVVVGYDGSDHAKRALERAMDMTGGSGDLVVVASAEPHLRSVTADAGSARQDPSDLRQRQEAIDSAKAFLQDRGIEAHFEEAYGDPASAIIEHAEGADLVVVGSRGLGRIERVLLGSVSTKVVQRAHCDVLVVR